MLESSKHYLYNFLWSGSDDTRPYERMLHEEDVYGSLVQRIAWDWIRRCIIVCGALIALICWPITLAAWLYYERFCVHPVKLYYQKTGRNLSLLSLCPMLRRECYRPTPYTVLLPGLSGHLHTFLLEFLRIPPPVDYDREFIETEDGISPLYLFPMVSTSSFQYSEPQTIFISLA